jgi:putative membrane protein
MRDQSRSGGADMKAQAFMHEAALGGLVEVELGRLASEKASSDEVKQFGQRMVTDHGKANTELKALAEKKSVTLPTELDSKHKQTVEKLSKLSGAAFDRAYMDEMRKDHKKDVSAFRQQSMSGSDPDVKSWAAATLPTLQEHMQMAERTHAAVGTSGKSITGSGSDNAAGGKTGPHSGTGNPSGGVTETPAPAGR